MSTVSQLGNFPNTIRNLDDKPNLSAANMKQALQQDTSVLWQKVIEVIDAVNEKSVVFVGNTAPDAAASSLSEGDIYLYVPDLP